MLIGASGPAFDSDAHIFELKLDGIRCLAYLWESGIELRNKRNKRLNTIYPELLEINQQAKTKCILDGELVVLKDGVPDFFEVQRRSLMTNAMKIKMLADKLPVSFVAYDILYANGKQITDLSLMQRKSLLSEIVTESERLAVTRIIEKNGEAFYKATADMGLEGIVAKRKDSKYYFGKRSKDWIKMKAMLDEDFIVCGYFSKGGGNTVSVIIGVYDEVALVYQGHVVMGISKFDYQKMMSIPKTTKSRHYAQFPDFEGAVWIMPELVCTVQYMERTPGGGLRQPVFKGLRDDG